VGTRRKKRLLPERGSKEQVAGLSFPSAFGTRKLVFKTSRKKRDRIRRAVVSFQKLALHLKQLVLFSPAFFSLEEKAGEKNEKIGLKRQAADLLNSLYNLWKF